MVATWRDESIEVEAQSPEIIPDWGPRPDWTEPPCPLPSGGWAHGVAVGHLHFHIGELESSGAIVIRVIFRPSTDQEVLVVAAADIEAVTRQLSPKLPNQLCVVPSRFTRDQLKDGHDVLHAHRRKWRLETFGRSAELHRHRNRRIGWSVIGGLLALGIIWTVSVGDSSAFGTCLVLALLPWWLTFWATRPMIRTSERGLVIGRVIPWDQVERVALMQNGQFHVVVQAYAGSVIVDRAIEHNSAQKRFTDFIASFDQFHQPRQMASSSSAEASVNRGAVSNNSARLTKADPRAQARMRAELHRGTGIQLDGAGTAATSYWAPDPTGAHELRLIRDGQWTPIVVTAGVPDSDPSLSGRASFEWICPATAPTRTAASEWFAPGTYVFRSTWKNPAIVPKPIWYSAVWKDNRPILVIEDNGRRFTAVDTGTSYPAAHRSRTRVRSHFSDSGLSIRATRKGAVIESTTGTSMASIYSAANQRPDTRTGDHTVVITVPNAIPMPLGLLILSYATRVAPFFTIEGGGG